MQRQCHSYPVSHPPTAPKPKQGTRQYTHTLPLSHTFFPQPANPKTPRTQQSLRCLATCLRDTHNQQRGLASNAAQRRAACNPFRYGCQGCMQHTCAAKHMPPAAHARGSMAPVLQGDAYCNPSSSGSLATRRQQTSQMTPTPTVLPPAQQQQPDNQGSPAAPAHSRDLLPAAVTPSLPAQLACGDGVRTSCFCELPPPPLLPCRW